MNRGAHIAAVSRRLAEHFRGRLLRQDDPDYAAAARVWNGMFDSLPGLIARCRDAEDVQVAIGVANATGVTTAIRCGGHSLAGFSTCKGGLVIDLSEMCQVQVDEGTRKARFSGGCLLGTVDAETQKFGFAFPAGVVSHTGAGGLILRGWNWLAEPSLRTILRQRSGFHLGPRGRLGAAGG